MRSIPFALALFAAAPVAADDLDKVRFGTDWVPQAGHGGWYQALADGTFEEFGLDVDILPGGPGVNNRPTLASGGLDFLLAGNLLLSFDNVQRGIPTLVVAAFFQKDPQALLAHAGVYDDFADLATAPEVLVSRDGQASFWRWLVKEHGFRDDQLRPYTGSLSQYLADEAVVQQGYTTAEPIAAHEKGADPEAFLLADQGWTSYAATLEVRAETVERYPDLVQRFVDASIIGWYTYLYGDNSAGNAAIIAANPEQTEDRLQQETAALKALGIVDGGDALTAGIGALSLDRIAAFLELATKAGLVEEGSVPLDKVATAEFVNKGVGLELKKELAGR